SRLRFALAWGDRDSLLIGGWAGAVEASGLAPAPFRCHPRSRSPISGVRSRLCALKQPTQARPGQEQRDDQKRHRDEAAQAHKRAETRPTASRTKNLLLTITIHSSDPATIFPPQVAACRNRALTRFLTITTTSRMASNSTAVSREG